MPSGAGRRICDDVVIEFGERGSLEFLACHAESIVARKTPLRQFDVGEELIQFDLERTHQGGQQNPDHAFEGEDVAAREIGHATAVAIDKIAGRNKGSNLIDRIGI